MNQPFDNESPTGQQPSSIPQQATEPVDENISSPDPAPKTHAKYPKAIPLLIFIGILSLALLTTRSMWMNKSAKIPEPNPSPSNTPTVSLDSDQYLLTITEFPPSAPIPNAYQLIGAAHIKIQNKATGEIIDKLIKPITATYNYGKAWGDTFEKCAYSEDEITSFVYNPSDKKLLPLEVQIDKTNKTITASLPYLFPQVYNQYTEVVYITPASKYIDGCGDVSRAYLDGERFVFKELGYSLQLPDPSQRPSVVGAESINAYIPLPNHEENNTDFFIYATLDRNNLPPIQYDQITHGYEMPKPESYIKSNEAVQSRKVTDVAGQPALFITTRSSDKEYRYIFIKNPAKHQDNISVMYVFQLSIPLKLEDGKRQNAITLYEQAVSSLIFTTPTID